MSPDRPPRANQRRQSTRVNTEFLARFTEAEHALKARLRRKSHDRIGASQLIDQYLSRNPLWGSDAEVLRRCKAIRDLITHERDTTRGDPVLVNLTRAKELAGVVQRLRHPEPVSKSFTCDVVTVHSDTPLAEILLMAHQHDFSQFPVLEVGRFRGMVTEHAITWWLGQCFEEWEGLPDLRDITALDVVRDAESERGIGFDFVRADLPTTEVIAMFSHRVQLEALLITASGGKSDPLLGIVTTWDAARFHP